MIVQYREVVETLSSAIVHDGTVDGHTYSIIFSSELQTPDSCGPFVFLGLRVQRIVFSPSAQLTRTRRGRVEALCI